MEVALELKVADMSNLSNKFQIFRRMSRIFHPWALSGEVKFRIASVPLLPSYNSIQSFTVSKSGRVKVLKVLGEIAKQLTMIATMIANNMENREKETKILTKMSI